MRAAVVQEPGSLPVCGEFPEPEPEAHQNELSLVAAGVHRVVRMIAAGSHYGSGDRYPMVPGVDAVARASDGRLVYTGWTTAPWGTMAERMVTPAAVDLPHGADPLAVAAGMNPTMSAWMPLSARVNEVGDLGTVLILGATGMAGRAAVQGALALGATRVVAAGRDPGRLSEVEALGAVPVVLDGAASAEPLATALDGIAPGIVLDYVWGAVAEAAFAALSRRGLDDDTADIAYVQIGSLGGATAAVPSALLRSRRLSIRGSGFGSVSTAAYLAELPRVMDLMAAGRIVLPYTAYSLKDVADAWTHAGADRAVVVP